MVLTRIRHKFVSIMLTDSGPPPLHTTPHHPHPTKNVGKVGHLRLAPPTKLLPASGIMQKKLQAALSPPTVAGMQVTDLELNQST